MFAILEQLGVLSGHEAPISGPKSPSEARHFCPLRDNLGLWYPVLAIAGTSNSELWVWKGLGHVFSVGGGNGGGLHSRGHGIGLV